LEAKGDFEAELSLATIKGHFHLSIAVVWLKAHIERSGLNFRCPIFGFGAAYVLRPLGEDIGADVLYHRYKALKRRPASFFFTPVFI